MIDRPESEEADAAEAIGAQELESLSVFLSFGIVPDHDAVGAQGTKAIFRAVHAIAAIDHHDVKFLLECEDVLRVVAARHKLVELKFCVGRDALSLLYLKPCEVVLDADDALDAFGPPMGRGAGPELKDMPIGPNAASKKVQTGIGNPWQGSALTVDRPPGLAASKPALLGQESVEPQFTIAHVPAAQRHATEYPSDHMLEHLGHLPFEICDCLILRKFVSQSTGI